MKGGKEKKKKHAHSLRRFPGVHHRPRPPSINLKATAGKKEETGGEMEGYPYMTNVRETRRLRRRRKAAAAAAAAAEYSRQKRRYGHGWIGRWERPIYGRMRSQDPFEKRCGIGRVYSSLFAGAFSAPILVKSYLRSAFLRKFLPHICRI